MKYSDYNRLFLNETALIEQSILEFANSDPENILMEVHFTKKDLQDPETLKKLLEKAAREKKIKEVLDIIFEYLTIAEAWVVGSFIKTATGSSVLGALGAFASWIGFLALTVKIIESLDNVMVMVHDNRIKKLREKCLKLIKACEKSSDPNAKRVIENCKKTIKAIDDHYSKLEKDEYKKKIDKYKKLIRDFKDILDGKSYLADFLSNPDEMKKFCFCYIFKIPVSKLDAGQKKADCWYPAYKAFFGDNELEDDKILVDEIGKVFPEFKNNDKINVYYAIDDTIFFYSKAKNKFYYGGFFSVYDVKRNVDIEKEIGHDIQSSMEGFITSAPKYGSFVKDFKDDIMEELKKDMDYIKVADIELETYYLSKPEK